MNDEKDLITRLNSVSNFFETAEILDLNVLEDLAGADLVGTNFANGNLAGANLSNADLSQADLSHTDLSGANLSGADLNGSNLAGANLGGADLIGTNLSNAVLQAANLCGCDLSGAQLNQANLMSVKLTRAFLSGACLNGANLSHAILKYAQLMNTDLSGANLNHADLSSVDLTTAKLDGASLFNTNLASANLVDASLCDVNLKDTNVVQAQFGGEQQDFEREVISDLESRGAILDGSIKSKKNIQAVWRKNSEKTSLIFGQLSTDDMTWMNSIGTEIEIPRKTLLIEEGTMLDELYIVLRGKLEVSLKSKKDNKIAELCRGSVVGEISLIGNRPTSATVRAIEDSFVLSIPRVALLSRLDRNVEFASRFYHAIAIFLSHRLLGANNHEFSENSAGSKSLYTRYPKSFDYQIIADANLKLLPVGGLTC
jgi:uncharacterized protein YjbI with pentapeptide repeats